MHILYKYNFFSSKLIIIVKCMLVSSQDYCNNICYRGSDVYFRKISKLIVEVFPQEKEVSSCILYFFIYLYNL